MNIEKRILVVEHDPNFQKAVVRNLKTKRYKVFVAEDAEAALRILDNEHIHVAIIDIRLRDHSDPKDISGLELAKLIQPPVAKLILTGYPSHKTVRGSWKEAGAIDHVAKQDGPKALLGEC